MLLNVDHAQLATAQVKAEWMVAIRQAREDLLSARRTLLSPAEAHVGKAASNHSAPSTPKAGKISIAQPASAKSGSFEMPDEEDDADDDLSHVDAESSMVSSVNESVASGDAPAAGDVGVPHDSWLTTDFAAKYANLQIHTDYSAPVWQPNTQSAACQRCGEAFAVWRRRHHCRLCGDLVCWACSTKVSCRHIFCLHAADAVVLPEFHHTSGTSWRAPNGRSCDECFATCFASTPVVEFSDDPFDVLVSTSDNTEAGMVDPQGKAGRSIPFFRRAMSAIDVLGLMTERRNEASGDGKKPRNVRSANASLSPKASAAMLAESKPASIQLLRRILGK